MSIVSKLVICGLQDQQSGKAASNIIGQKSEKALMAASVKKGKKGRSGQAPADKDARISYNKSGSVFKRMQEQKEAATAGSGRAPALEDGDGPVRKKAAALKL